MKNLKKCGMTSECWSGFTCILGVGFIIIATILPLMTMSGFGILGMFLVGAILCRHKCDCCSYQHMHEHHGMDDTCCMEEKSESKAKKAAVKK